VHELPSVFPGRPPPYLVPLTSHRPRSLAIVGVPLASDPTDLPPASRPPDGLLPSSSRRSPALELPTFSSPRALYGLPPSSSRPCAADLDALAPSASRSSSCRLPILALEILPAPSLRSRPRAAAVLKLELLHGQFHVTKSTAKSGGQKQAALPPKCRRRSLLELFSENNKVQGNLVCSFCENSVQLL
jgi:hypothetical protein